MLGWDGAGQMKKDDVRPAPYQCSETDEYSSSIKDYVVKISF